MKSWIENANEITNHRQWFSHYIRYILSEYKTLTVCNISYDYRGCVIICEMNNTRRTLIISQYLMNAVIRMRLDKDHNSYSYYRIFETQLKLKVLEAFYVTEIND